MKQPKQASSGFTIVELLIVVVVIAILAAITIVSYNGITSRAKMAVQASDLASWKKKSELHKIENNISCPDNYVFIYGNSVLGTSDFCVMKYEAKIQGNDNGQTPYSTALVAESRPAGTPWVNIAQSQAITAAAATGGHLITEAEWMTIAADVLSVKYNWSGGAVGSGYIYQGHVNANPASALAASTDDTDTLNGITGGTGTTSGTNSPRDYYLSSGDAIWDLSGNVWEWVQQAVGAPTLTVSQIGVSGEVGAWREWSLSSLSLGNLATVSRPSTLNSWTNPVFHVNLAGLTWSANAGVGQSYANHADSASRAFLRGGHWNDGSNAGVVALSMNYSASNSGIHIGFRVVK